MNEIKSSVPFFPFNKAKLVPKKWGKRFLFCLPLATDCFSTFGWAKDVDNFKKMLFCVHPGYITCRGTMSGLSSMLWFREVWNRDSCDHTAKDTVHLSHILCCLQKFQVHQK